MPLPTYLVELQFGSSGYVDVTQYVQNVSINRGINRNLDDFSAGSVSVTFVNNNRVFDPLNTSSPLWYGTGGYTLVQPAGRIRISSNGVRRFTGFVQDWDFAYEDSGFDATASLTALDMMYRVSNAAFTGGTASVIQDTGTRIRTVMSDNSFDAADYAGVYGGQTLLGYDVNQPGDNVLAYLQNVARSEPADFYSNASAVMELKDRSFTDYVWQNSTRQNVVAYPSTATWYGLDEYDNRELNSGWVHGTAHAGSLTPFISGTVNRAGTAIDTVSPSQTRVLFEYTNRNPELFASLGNSFVFSGYIRGYVGTIDIYYNLVDVNGFLVGATAFSVSPASTATWTNITRTVTAVDDVARIYLSAEIVAGTAHPATRLYGNGWLVEAGTAFINYFDGDYNPYISSGSTAYEVAWSGESYKSTSGLLTSVATAVSAPALVTFADANSQGTAYGNGTGIPFTNLEVVYGSEQLYNKVQVLGVNATAVVEDTPSQLLYGLRGYGQTDNLTTSTTKPAQIASAFLGEFRLPEYRANQLTVALESLTTVQQTAVLGIDIRDVVRVCFQPSVQGAVVDKYYQVLGVSANADVERDAVTLNLASLDNLSFRLDSPYLGVLDTGILA
jgi:hypothetical protein